LDEIERVLREARVIALYDWPGAEMPAALDRAGYLVVGHEPDGAKHYHVSSVADGPRPMQLADGSFLLSSQIERLPERVDIVGTYRPPDEQLEIAREAAKLGAKCYWIEPGEGSSPEARSFAAEAGMLFVEGEGLAAAVQRLGIVLKADG
jgi:predicted CoA-binding protein